MQRKLHYKSNPEEHSFDLDLDADKYKDKPETITSDACFLFLKDINCANNHYYPVLAQNPLSNTSLKKSVGISKYHILEEYPELVMCRNTPKSSLLNI